MSNTKATEVEATEVETNNRVEANGEGRVNNTGLDLTQIVTMAEAAYSTVNPTGEIGDDMMPDVQKARTAWHFAGPIEHIMDGLHRAQNGTEYNGRVRRGIKHYAEMIKTQIVNAQASGDLFSLDGQDLARFHNASPDALTERGLRLRDQMSDLQLLAELISQMQTVLMQGRELALQPDFQAGSPDERPYRNPDARRQAAISRETASAGDMATLSAAFNI